MSRRADHRRTAFLCHRGSPPQNGTSEPFFVSLLEFLFHFWRIGVKASGLMSQWSQGTAWAEAATDACPRITTGCARCSSPRMRCPEAPEAARRFALAHPEDVAFGTVAGIAEHAGVQPSTLVRFAKSLGYDGFSHLQQIFRDRLRERFPDYRERLQGLRDAEGAMFMRLSLLEGFTGAAAVSLERMRETVRPEELSRAIETWPGPTRLSSRRPPGVPDLGLLRLCLRQARGTRDPDRPCGPARARAARHRRPSAMRCSPSASRPTLRSPRIFAAAAAQRDVPVVAITDSAFSPLVTSADVWLEVAEADFGAFRSLSASFALAMALAVATAEKRAG